MVNPVEFSNQRKDQRVSSELPARISIGTQLTVQGQLRDISLKSAFIRIKNSIFIETNEEVGFAIQCSQNENDVIQGMACVSRIMPGEGIGVYFTRMDTGSERRLQKLIQKAGQ